MKRNRMWGRLTLFGAVLLTGCEVRASYGSRPTERGPTQPYQWENIQRTEPDTFGVVCYRDRMAGYGAFSCVKVTP